MRIGVCIIPRIGCAKCTHHVENGRPIKVGHVNKAEGEEGLISPLPHFDANFVLNWVFPPLSPSITLLFLPPSIKVQSASREEEEELEEEEEEWVSLAQNSAKRTNLLKALPSPLAATSEHNTSRQHPIDRARLKD